MTVLSKIIESSERLFMTYGLKSISMDDIATDLGMSKKTIYKHFSTKEKLIGITLTHFLKKEKKIVGKINRESENAVDEILKIGHHIIRMAGKFRPTLLFDLKKYHAANWLLVEEHHYDFIQGVISENLKRGIAEGYFRRALHVEVIAKLYVAKSLLISNDKEFASDETPLESLVKEHLLYHLYGVLSKEGIKLVENYDLEQI